jgi:hypothetical protein
MARKTRKYYKKNHINHLAIQNKDAKKGTQLKCKLKTCRTKMYQSVYGATTGGSIRTTRQLYF